jgi:hypothetical protein
MFHSETQRQEAATRRKIAAAQYRPDHIRLLIVAEAPPDALDRYFYFEVVSSHDSLFRYVYQGITGNEPSRYDKPRQLAELRDLGVFLIDVIENPAEFRPWGECIRSLADRCRGLNPDHIVLIKADVFDSAYRLLRDEGLPVVKQRIPFPGSGQQRKFESAFRSALDQIGFIT